MLPVMPSALHLVPRHKRAAQHTGGPLDTPQDLWQAIKTDPAWRWPAVALLAFAGWLFFFFSDTEKR